MSFFRLPKLFKARASRESSSDRSGGTGRSERKAGRRRRAAGPRRLLIDPLEARELLSVSPADMSDKLVTQQLDVYNAAFPEATLRAWYPAKSQFTNAAKALAADNSGDFVVTWTRNDPVIGTDGSTVIDPVTGLAKTDLNIYARYLTDEVQRVFLPDGVLTNNLAPPANGKFWLVWGGNEVQKLTITATYEPYTYTYWQSLISGSFTLAFDVDNNGTLETATVVFDESYFGVPNDPRNPQVAIQNALRGMGGVLSDCTVQAISPQEYTINFGDQSQTGAYPPNTAFPAIQVQGASFTTGFLPAVQTSVVRQPTLIGGANGIQVSPTDPLATATQIVNAFTNTTQAYTIAPIDVQAPDEYNDVAPSPAPYYQPLIQRAATPGVTVVPVDEATCLELGYTYGTVFDVTFAGDWAKQDVPEMKLTAARDENNQPLVLPATPVKTLKQSSGEFRVNPDEPADELTGEPDPHDQRNPAVAMDADGDFVITWESDIPDSVIYNSGSDVFARRFSPMGIIADTDLATLRGAVTDGRGNDVQAVRSWVDDIQVLKFDANAPGPLVGTFLLTIPNAVTGENWTSQPITFDSRALADVGAAIQQGLITAGYDGVQVRQLTGVDPYEFEATFGGRQAGLDQPAIVIAPDELDATLSVTDETDPSGTFLVNTTTTLRQVTPAIAMDHDGNFMITWATIAQDLSYFNRISYQRYTRDGDRISSETQPPPQTADTTALYLNPAVAMSPDGHFALAWEFTTDPGFYNGAIYWTSVQARIYDATGAPTSAFLALAGTAAAHPSLAFDPANNLAVAWDVITGDNINSTNTNDSQAQVFDVNGVQIRTPFRINSGSDSGTGAASWCLEQGAPQMGFDADGDLVASYGSFGYDSSGIQYGGGYGVDLSNEVYIPGSYFSAYINNNTNADLKGFFDPATDYLYAYQGNSYQSSNVDGAIEWRLMNAKSVGATDEQLGRLRAILETVGGLLRGDANGVMFTRWDTDPNAQSVNNTLTSDNQANNKRDGHNTRIILAIPQLASSGNLDFTLVRDNMGAGNWDNFTVNVVYAGNPATVNPGPTLDAIRTTFNGLRLVGDNWPATGNWYYTQDATRVQVRLMDFYELFLRDGTPWDADPYNLPTPANGGSYYFYELNFQGEAHDSPFYLYFRGPNWGQLNTPIQNVFDYAYTYTETYGDEGTSQFNQSIAVAPNGNFVMAWTEQEEYTNGASSNTNIYYRRFADSAGDTAGPLVTDVLNDSGRVLYENDTVVVPPGGSDGSKLVLTFDEDMLASGADSVTNPNNYHLFSNGVELIGGVSSVVYGMNKAFDWGLTSVPSNKWEAVLTLDGNGATPGTPALGVASYALELDPPTSTTSGLRDRSGNPLGSSGRVPGGAPFVRNFEVSELVTPPNPPPPWDVPVTPTTPPLGTDGTTYPESPGSVAVDADGDYVVVWTAPDAGGRDRVYFRLFNDDGTGAAGVRSDGTSMGNVTAVAPEGSAPEIPFDTQRYATVACDANGDFVVTWTSFADGTDTGEQDVYARRFDATGMPQGDAFRVNTYLTNIQTWPSVAMDVAGDFVIAWSSLGQEDNNQLGNGYGVYARRYDSFGQPLAPEFQVNLTTGGDQRFSSVAMDNQGGFVVTWTSSANGVGDDIMYRSYLPDGSPQLGPMAGEEIVNQTLQGTQWHSDVAMRSNGTQFVVSWTSLGQDGSGDGIYSRVFGRSLQPQGVQVYSDPDIPAAGALITDALLVQTQFPPLPPVWTYEPYHDTVFDIDISDAITIGDLNVRVDILHARVSDLTITLVDPNGNEYILSDRNPKNGGNYLDNPAANFVGYQGTIFDSESLTPITVFPLPNGAYAGRYAPEMNLATLNGKLATGKWQLKIRDWRPGPFDPAFPNLYLPISNRIMSWALEITPATPAGPEFRVNTSFQGNQSYSSAAMDPLGRFVVTWSGRGNQSGQQDVSGTGGVYLQRYNNTQDSDGFPIRTGGETRVNRFTAGNQWFSSVATDVDGNFVVVWTGVDSNDATKTAVYGFAYSNTLHLADTSGPMVTDVFDPATDERIFSGDVVRSGLQSLLVQFDENLWTRDESDGSPGLRSVRNVLNWRLDRGGTEIIGGIQSVAFQYNGDTRQYEATVTFSSALIPGSYALIVKDAITDVAPKTADNPLAPNALDGDYDGTPGTQPSNTGESGYRFFFTVDSPAAAEFRVNQTTVGEQQFSLHLGTGQGAENSVRSLAVDNDGDFVVVWTSYGQDEPTDPTAAGVYARVFDRNGVPVQRWDEEAGAWVDTEFQVNQYIDGHQRNAVVACDADGDFVVVWESEGEDANHTWGVYARRYDSTGTPLGDEFRVNTLIANDQVNPGVAMDDMGNFVVVWATGGQTYSFYNDIRGQLFDRLGETVGTEFLVNQANIPGTNLIPGSSENHPTVAMDPIGNFVVTWDEVTVQRNGAAWDSVILARLFDRTGQPNATTPGEFQVDIGDDGFTSDPEHNPHEPAGGGNEISRTARNPQAAMDDAGNFIIAWESYHDNDLDDVPGPDSYGIYFRRFNSDGTAEMAAEHQANLVITTTGDNPATGNPWTVPNPDIHGDVFAYGQVNPSVAMDADGDYSIVWNGNGAQPDPLGPESRPIVNADPAGIWVRSFHAGIPDGEVEPEFVSVQSRVNLTQPGIQEFPTIGMTRDGDRVVVWDGRGVGDTEGIFARRYDELTDTAGPLVSDVFAGGVSIGITTIQSGALLPVPPGPPNTPVPPTVLTTDSTQVDANVTSLSVVFDENMCNVGPGDERYDNSVLNPVNYRLSLNGVDVSGWIGDNITFGWNPQTNKYEAALTLDADPTTADLEPLPDGRYVLTVAGNLQDAAGNAMGISGLTPYGTAYVSTQFDMGTAGPGDPTEPDDPVDPAPTGPQDSPAVAKDPGGQYSVVVWVTRGQTVGTVIDGYTQGNITAQVYDVDGNPIGTQQVVNTYLTGSQINPDVAMDANGNFVVVWSGPGQDGQNGVIDATGIFYRRFHVATDTVTALDSYQIKANTYALNTQEQPAVAMDSAGDFVITWTGEGQAGADTRTFDARGVWARRFSRAGGALDDNQFRVNTYTSNAQESPDVAMNAAGTCYFIVWRSEQQDAGAWGVYGQRFTWSGTPNTVVRNGDEMHLNQNTYGARISPQVALDDAGRSVVVWSTLRADGYADHVYRRQFLANGTAIDARELPADDGSSAGYLKQQGSVAMCSTGQYFVVSWTSWAQDEADSDPPRSSEGVYAHVYYNDNPDDPTSTWDDYAPEGLPVGDFRLNNTTAGNQNDPQVAMDSSGNITAVWVSPAVTATGLVIRHMTVTGSAGSVSPKSVVLGTSSDDQVVVGVSSGPVGWVVLLNGEQQSIGAHASGLIVDGSGGNNTLVVQGSAGREIYEIYPDHVVVTDPVTHFSLTARDIQVANLDGVAGTDRAVFYGSTGSDTFTFHADTLAASLSGGVNTFTTSRITDVEATASGANDTALLYDSANKDVFSATGTSATLTPYTGSAYSAKVTGFRTVQAYSTAGGSDLAKLQGATGDAGDVLVADPSYTSLTDNASYLAQANGFMEVQAYGSGGADRATFYDSDSSLPDTFTADAKSGEATMVWGTRAYTKAYFFNNLEAIARPGNSDTARLNDSAQADTFVADSQSGTLSGVGYSYKAAGFRNLYASATATDGKTDTATLNDSAGSDVFIGTSTYAMLTGPGYTVRANGFDSSAAWSARGGTDTAKLYDSAKNDTFTASVDVCSLLGNEAHGFARVQASALNGGTDTAKFTDTAGKDWFVAGQGYAYLYNESRSFYARATGFHNVEATSSGQGDQANLTDSALDDTFNGYATRAEMLFGPSASLGSVKVSGFPNVTASATMGGKDLANLTSSLGNDSFAGSFDGSAATGTLSGQDSNGSYFSVRAEKFEQVKANAGLSGGHSARLTDSALVDLLYLQGSLARLTDLDAAAGLWATGFGNVKATLSSKDDKVQVVPPVNYTYTIDQPK